MNFLRHPAWLWVEKHDKSKLPPIGPSLQAIFDTGHEFEQYAESLFEGGVRIEFGDYLSMTNRTQEAIASGAKLIFQPRFEWQDFTFIADIVQFVGDDELDLYEIKSSTGVRKDHLYDLAFQSAVLAGLGYKVRQVFVLHVNNQYVRQGDIEPEKFVSKVDVTSEVYELANFTAEQMPKAAEMVRQKEMPDPSYENLGILGRKSEWKPIFENISPSPTDTPVGGEVIINKTEIKRFLNEWQYPLYFLDYETMSSLVPKFDGYRPYQQVPVQYSLHILREPDGELEHREFLQTENVDPARSLANQLIGDLGDKGSIVTWNMSFEKSCNKLLGEICPNLTEQMQAINDRVVDLMTPFKSKWYDDPRFGGSASIKNVLPVLCPELSYAELAVQKGDQAQNLWMGTVLSDKNPENRQQIFSDLREYCALDTFAMVEIWRVLKKART